MSQTALSSGVDGQTVEACPNCDTTERIARCVTGSPNSTRDATEPDYKCHHCGAIFDRPNVRPREGCGLGLHGVALFLFSVPPDADLDELPDLYDNWRDSE